MMFVSWKISLCFYNFAIFYYPLGQCFRYSVKIQKTFSSVPCLNWFQLLLLNPSCNLHLVKRVKGEIGKLWPRIQSLHWMRWDAISYLKPQWVWGRINGKGMMWKTANWKAITTTWEKSSWILHHAAEILF